MAWVRNGLFHREGTKEDKARDTKWTPPCPWLCPPSCLRGEKKHPTSADPPRSAELPHRPRTLASQWSTGDRPSGSALPAPWHAASRKRDRPTATPAARDSQIPGRLSCADNASRQHCAPGTSESARRAFPNCDRKSCP